MGKVFLLICNQAALEPVLFTGGGGKDPRHSEAGRGEWWILPTCEYVVGLVNCVSSFHRVHSVGDDDVL